MRRPRSELGAGSGPDPAATRASDADRQRVADSLSEHAGQGRLTMEELSERLERVFSARTLGELDAVVHDLPEPGGRTRLPSRDDPKRRELSSHLTSFVLVNLLLIAVWALSGAGYFWPIWPLLGWGIGVASHASEALFGRSALRLGTCPRAGRGASARAGSPRAGTSG